MQLFGVYEVERGRVDLYLEGSALPPRLHQNLGNPFLDMPVALSQCGNHRHPFFLDFIARLGLPSWPIARVTPACRHERFPRACEMADKCLRTRYSFLGKVVLCAAIQVEAGTYVMRLHLLAGLSYTWQQRHESLLITDAM